jgi:hypothetical protein
MDEIAMDMYINPRILDCRDAATPILSVVTCVLCGSVVADTEVHQKFHQHHGHAGFGVSNEW